MIMELKPCPFCGGEAVMQTFTTAMEKEPRYRVRCSNCWCQTDWDNWTVEEAEAEWNTRKEPRCRNCRKDDTLECPVCYIEKQQMVFVRHDPDWYCGDYEEEKN